MYLFIYKNVFTFIYIYTGMLRSSPFGDVERICRHLELTCRGMLRSSPFFYKTNIVKMRPSLFPKKEHTRPKEQKGQSKAAVDPGRRDLIVYMVKGPPSHIGNPNIMVT